MVLYFVPQRTESTYGRRQDRTGGFRKEVFHDDSDQVSWRRIGRADASALQEAVRKGRLDQGHQAEGVLRETVRASAPGGPEVVRATDPGEHAADTVQGAVAELS